MKTKDLLKGMLMTAGLCIAVATWAQPVTTGNTTPCDPNGKDSALTLRNYSLMHEEVRQKRYESAHHDWIYVFENAPCFREQTYADGADIYEALIKKNSKDAKRKAELLDTLDLIYQRRIQYFGNEGFVKGKWGKDILSLDRANAEKGIKLIEESIKLDGKKIESSIVLPYFQAVIGQEKKNKLTKDDILKVYETLTEIIDYNVKNNTEDAQLGIYDSKMTLENLVENTFTAEIPQLFEPGVILTFQPSYSSPRYEVTNVDSIYITVNNNITEAAGSKVFYVKKAWNVTQESVNILAAPYLDCKSLAAIYGPKFDADPTNIELIEKILLFLNNARCDGEDLYIKVSEAYVKQKPSALAYRALGNAYKKAKNGAKALENFEKAIGLEEDPKVKVNDYINLAKAALVGRNYIQAKNYADKALAIDPNKGEAYILIGDAYTYAAGNCTVKIDANAIYWVAVDMYLKAKAVDPGVAGAANRRIATYSKYFPEKSKAFFHSINEGDTYTLSCWPNLSTKARF